jgi:hypothetical protein
LETQNGAGGQAELAGPTATTGLDPKGVVAFVVALLVPGAGHLMLGRRLRGGLIAGVLIATFLGGLALHGQLYTVDRTNYISIFFVFANAGSGLLYLVSLLAGIGIEIQAQMPTYEYGTKFLLVVGLLNYLAALDAYDIAAGRKS